MLNIHGEMALRKLAGMWGESRLLFFAERGKYIALSIVPNCIASKAVDSVGEEVHYWPVGVTKGQRYPQQ